MPIIKKLTPQEAQRIAAGEVIERPSNVVKELMENSIDAGATIVTIKIKDGGKTLISCIDDGCGMDAIDARGCIETHATSKIMRLEDLYSIQTFGFRGEALGSLAAVAMLCITTKNAEQAEALRLTIEHNNIVREEIVAHHTGTSIEVHNLFYTVPARLKFLKTNATEQRHIIQIFDALCLAHPEIHAQLIIDDAIHSRYPATKTIHERANQILLRTTDLPLIALFHEHKGITISGAISNHQMYRFDKNSIYFFVNKRWIKNVGLSRAIMRAYTVLPAGKFPVVSLDITINPSVIDVNIHPRKEEVAFTHAVLVENAVVQAIKTALERELRSYMQQSNVPSQPIYATSFISESIVSPPKPYSFTAGLREMPTNVPSISTHNNFVQNSIAPTNDVMTQRSTIVLGQLDNTYILAATDKGLTIIDQHAAHERILYERYASRDNEIETVQLLFPEIVPLSSADFLSFNEYRKIFTDHSIITEEFGLNQIRITALPVFAKHISGQELIHTILASIHQISTKSDAHIILTNAVRANIACKAAIKAGDSLTIPHMQQLLRDFEKTTNNITCPHGRPTYWHISLQEFEKKFQRIK